MNEDKILYNNFMSGNRRAFEEIVEKYREKMIYFIYEYVKRIDIAEDLAQDVFVYLLVNKGKFCFDCSLKTYLYIIAKSRALNYLKASDTKVFQLEDYANTEDLKELEEVVFNSIRDENLKSAINKLDSKQAKILYLAKIEEMKIKDISKILDMSETQIRVTIHRAKKKLKEMIGKEDDLYA